MNRFCQSIHRHLLAPTQLSQARILAVLTPFKRSMHLRRHAASVIIARVQLVAALFAVLVPLCSVIDLLTFPPAMAGGMFVLRLLSTGIFVLLALPRDLSTSRPYTQSVVMLLVLLMVPPLFYLLSLQVIDPAGLTDTQRLIARLYAFMPTVVLGGLAVFPLTALETLLFSLPVIVAGIFGLLHGGTLFSLAEHGATLWFMLMMIGVSMFSGMSQCHYMATLIQRAASDPLTNAYTRDSGNETLDLVFRLADMGNKPLCLLFIDIDHFKTINDVYGHEAGDQTLRDMAEGIRECLRRSDHLIRWGGEEFVVVLPDTPLADVDILLRRLRRQAFGMRPDGTPLTASIGISEAKADHATNWHDMIRLADERMYQAKHAGRDRAVLPNGVTLTLVPENPA